MSDALDEEWAKWSNEMDRKAYEKRSSEAQPLLDPSQPLHPLGGGGPRSGCSCSQCEAQRTARRSGEDQPKGNGGGGWSHEDGIALVRKWTERLGCTAPEAYENVLLSFGSAVAHAVNGAVVRTMLAGLASEAALPATFKYPGPDHERVPAEAPRELCNGCRAVQPGPHSPGCTETRTTPERVGPEASPEEMGRRHVAAHLAMAEVHSPGGKRVVLETPCPRCRLRVLERNLAEERARGLAIELEIANERIRERDQPGESAEALSVDCASPAVVQPAPSGSPTDGTTSRAAPNACVICGEPLAKYALDRPCGDEVCGAFCAGRQLERTTAALDAQPGAAPTPSVAVWVGTACETCEYVITNCECDVRPSSGSLPATFDEAWAKMAAAGYQYGPDALGHVRFGWTLREELQADLDAQAGLSSSPDDAWDAAIRAAQLIAEEDFCWGTAARIRALVGQFTSVG